MTSCPGSSAAQPAAADHTPRRSCAKPVSRLSALIRLFAPWKWRRKKKSDRFAQTSRSLEHRMSVRASKEDLIQRGVLLPDLKSDFSPKIQQLDLCADDPAGKRDGGQSAGLSRVSPATSHLTGAVATCLVGVGPLLRSSLTGRPATDDLRDLTPEASHKSATDPHIATVTSTATLQSRGMSRPIPLPASHFPSLAERAVLSAISAELQLNFLEAKSRYVARVLWTCRHLMLLFWCQGAEVQCERVAGRTGVASRSHIQ